PMFLVVAMGAIGQTRAPKQSETGKGALEVTSASEEPSGQTPAPQIRFELGDGTPVRLRLAQTVSSATAKENDTVSFEVLHELKVGNVVVITTGGAAWGKV